MSAASYCAGPDAWHVGDLILPNGRFLVRGFGSVVTRASACRVGIIYWDAVGSGRMWEITLEVKKRETHGTG